MAFMCPKMDVAGGLVLGMSERQFYVGNGVRDVGHFGSFG